MNSLLTHSVQQVENARRERHLDREYLVVPVVALREMILDCSNCVQGGEYAPAEEIALSVPGWEGRPVTLGHPKNARGEPVSANTRAAQEATNVGKFFNVRFVDDRKLKGEIWLDIELASRSDEGKEAIQRFEEGDELVEVSTSYFAQRIDEPGVFEGRRYAVRQVGFIPDHLAILLDQPGACSLQDGCGAPRTNEEDEMKEEKQGTGFKEQLLAVLSGVFDMGTTLHVNSETEDTVNREKLIKQLLGNEHVAAIHTEEQLAEFDDEKLKAVASLAGIECGGCQDGPAANEDGGDEAEEEAAGEDAGAEASASEDEEDDEPAGEETGEEESDEEDDEEEDQVQLSKKEAEFLRGLMKDHGSLETVLNSAKEEAARRDKMRKVLVKELTENKRCAISERELKGMTLEALEGVQRSLNPTSYAGAGGPRVVDNEDDDQPAPPPQILLAHNDEDEED